MNGQVYKDGSLVESWDDTARTYTDHRTGQTRPYTTAENTAADQRAADASQMRDVQQRLAAIEKHLWPPTTGTPPAGTTAPTLAARGGVWPPGTLITDAGKTWRNETTVPLTSAPSAFPGTPGQWTHLFREVTIGTPAPTRPAGYVGTWNKDATYTVGNVVDKDGRYWRCLVAHGAERQGTWAPGVAHTIWTDAGAA